MKWFKGLLRWSIWREIKLMSRLHVIIDRVAVWVRARNLSVWKRWMVKVLRFYQRFNGNGKGNGRRE